MRNEKVLISLIRKIADLLSEECNRNKEFAERLSSLISNTPRRKSTISKTGEATSSERLPDIYAEWNVRGDTNFRLWIRDQPITLLRAIIRAQGFDTTRRTSKWKEVEKLADYIADSLRARLSRGSAFIRSDTKESQDP
jgi:hypothetical protein